MFFSPISSPSMCRAATWRSGGGRSTVSAALIRNIARRATMWIFAGGSKPKAALSRFRRARLYGTIDGSRWRPFASSRRATAKPRRCCASNISSSLVRLAPRNGRARYTARRGSHGSSASRRSITACLVRASSSRSILLRFHSSPRISAASNGSGSPCLWVFSGFRSNGCVRCLLSCCWER